MADMKKNKRKSRENPNHKAEKPNKMPKPKTLSNGDHKNKKRKGVDDKKKKMTGPRLPSSLRKELARLNPRDEFNGDVEDINSEEGNDLYEYEEGVPDEESMKNHRYDRVDNYEYELPDQFKDENVRSEDEDNEYGGGGNSDNDDVDDGRHLRMLQGITGMPTEAFEDKKKRKNVVITEAYPESEYNPSRDVLDGKGHVTIEDLVESLQGKSGYSQLRKRTQQMEKKSVTLQAPLPREDRDKLNRRAAYEVSKKDITKWEPLIKRNREAPTIIFDRDIDLGFSTVGAIASEFEPRTEFEKKMAALVHDDKVMEAHKEDGAKLLELNEISLEDYKRQQNHIAKMRSLLFHHEVKMKRIKKIKSKTYRRLYKKDRSKLGSADLLMDPEAAKEQAMKQEFKRAEERMTLRHKNRSKWAKRILERGLNAQDEGTRAAMAEQLNEHTRLTRKMKSMRDTGSSDDSSHEDNDDGDSSDSDQDEASKVLKKAKQRTLKILEEDNEVPLSGVLSLPFMVRGLKKKGEAASEEAKLALQEYESSLKQLEDTDEAENKKMGVVSGRRVFGGPIKQVAEQKKTIKRDGDYSDSDDEIEIEAEEENEGSLFKTNGLQRDVIPKDSKTHQDSVSQGFDDIVSGPGPKTTYEVAIFASDTWRKMPSQKVGKNIKGPSNGVQTFTQNEVLEEVEEGINSEGEMVDGILSSSPKGIYKLPSQEDLIREAFAGDDVEEEFAKDKDEILNEENPEAEKPVLLPGWGQWTHVQKKKGLPSWMVEEHEIAKRKRDEALKTRKDAHLKHVIISEKLDKKAEKLHTKTLPYPFTSKEVYEQSIRMPIGPEFNPATAVGALNRPEVLKRPGVIIKPVKFEEVDPYKKSDEHGRKGQKQKPRRKGSRSKLKAVVAKS